MILIESLKKQYGKRTALDIPKLEVSKGDILGLVGNNGAGKSTLLCLILDLLKADSGNVRISNINVSKSEEWKNISSSYLGEEFLINYLTPFEYLSFIGEFRQISKKDIEIFINDYSHFFEENFFNEKKLIQNLSKGNKAKIGIIGALLSKPELLILDEPFANLDPSSQFKLAKILKNINIASKTTILVSAHNLEHIADVCNRVLLLEQGKLKKDLQKNENTIEYLNNYFKSPKQ